MNMFFVFKGDLPTDLYIDRLSRLAGAEIVAAFPSRGEAVSFAMGIENAGVVVVERAFNLAAGDENNLISEFEWNEAKEEIELTGEIVITGNPIVGETLLAQVNSLNGKGPIHYTWKRSVDGLGEQWEAIAGTSTEKVGHIITRDDVGQFIAVAITRDNTVGFVASEKVGPIVEIDSPIAGGET